MSVVNWWVTYPATPVNGVLISDRLKAVMNNASVADEPDVVCPTSLLEDLRPFFIDRTDAAATMDPYGFPRYSRRAAEVMFDTSQPSRTLCRSLRSYVGQDQMVANWVLHLFKENQSDLFAVSLKIADVYSHFAWRFADRETLERIVPQICPASLTSGDSATRARAYQLVEELDPAVAQAMLPAYRFVDDFVGFIVSEMDPHSILVIVSDHGFSWQGGVYEHNPLGSYPETSPPGIIIVKGDGIRPGRIEVASLFDIIPTILYAFNEPVGEDMDGRSLKKLFDEPFLFGKRDERFIPTYGSGGAQSNDPFPLGAAEYELLEDLRSLGYIGGGASRPSSDPESGANPGDSNGSGDVAVRSAAVRVRRRLSQTA